MERYTNGKVKKSFGISRENNLTVEKAIRKATREALKMHKDAKNPVAIWRDGKVVIIQPDEIILS